MLILALLLSLGASAQADVYDCNASVELLIDNPRPVPEPEFVPAPEPELIPTPPPTVDPGPEPVIDPAPAPINIPQPVDDPLPRPPGEA